MASIHARFVQRHEGARRRTAAVGDEDVEPAERLDGRLDGPRHVFGPPQVGLDREHLAAGRLDRRRGRRQRGAAARADRHAHAVARQRLGGRPPEALAGRADQGDP